MVLTIPRRVNWMLICAGGLGLAAAILHQASASRALERELRQARIDERALAALRSECTRLQLARPAHVELERMRAGSDELGAIRAEVQTLRQQLDAAQHRSEAPSKEKFAIGSVVTAADWTNAGMGSPQSTLETVLWAGAGGDVDALAKTLLLMNRGPAQKVWASAPEELRRQHPSAEQLIAFLTVRDLPLGSAKVRQFTPLEGWPNPAAQMKLLVRDENGKAREVDLLFTNPGSGWKLVVHPGVVDKYAAMLKSGGVTPAR